MSELVRIERRDYADPVVTTLVSELQQEYRMRYGTPDDTPVESEEFNAPQGAFFVALQGEHPVGCAGWRALDQATAELKRVFVIDSARGAGIAGRLIDVIEHDTVSQGYKELVLVTGIAQPEAISLYQSRGYRKVRPFGFYADSPDARFFGTTLEISPDVKAIGSDASSSADE